MQYCWIGKAWDTIYRLSPMTVDETGAVLHKHVLTPQYLDTNMEDCNRLKFSLREQVARSVLRYGTPTASPSRPLSQLRCPATIIAYGTLQLRTLEGGAFSVFWGGRAGDKGALGVNAWRTSTRPLATAYGQQIH